MPRSSYVIKFIRRLTFQPDTHIFTLLQKYHEIGKFDVYLFSKNFQRACLPLRPCCRMCFFFGGGGKLSNPLNLFLVDGELVRAGCDGELVITLCDREMGVMESWVD